MPFWRRRRDEERPEETQTTPETDTPIDPEAVPEGWEPDPADFDERVAAEPEPPPLTEPALTIESMPAEEPIAAGAAPRVRIQINATPWAVIRVDGEDVGVTPLAGVMLEPGLHRFEARFPNGEVEEREIEVDEIRRFVSFRQTGDEAVSE